MKKLIVFLLLSCKTIDVVPDQRAVKRARVSNWLAPCIANCNTYWCSNNCIEVSKAMCKEVKLEPTCGIDGLYGAVPQLKTRN